MGNGQSKTEENGSPFNKTNYQLAPVADLNIQKLSVWNIDKIISQVQASVFAMLYLSFFKLCTKSYNFNCHILVWQRIAIFDTVPVVHAEDDNSEVVSVQWYCRCGVRGGEGANLGPPVYEGIN